MNKFISKAEIVEYFVEEVDDYDVKTLIAIVKEMKKDYFESLTIDELMQHLSEYGYLEPEPFNPFELNEGDTLKIV